METMAHKIINFVISGLLGIIAISVFQYAFYKFSPSSLWVKYYEVEPSKEIFTIGEELTFVSSSKTNLTANFRYEDILY